jgi:hypothetical protein
MKTRRRAQQQHARRRPQQETGRKEVSHGCIGEVSEGGGKQERSLSRSEQVPGLVRREVTRGAFEGAVSIIEFLEPLLKGTEKDRNNEKGAAAAAARKVKTTAGDEEGGESTCVPLGEGQQAPEATAQRQQTRRG